MAAAKIVRIITRLNIGGPAQQAAGLADRMAAQGWKTVLVTGTIDPSEGEMNHLLEGRSVRRISLPSLQRSIHPIQDLRATLALIRILLRERPDILHTHMAKAGTLGRLAGVCYRLVTRRPLKMVHTFHGHVIEGYFSPFASTLFRILERWLGRQTHCLIAVSPSVRDDLIRLQIAGPDQIRVIPLGLPLEPLFALAPPPGTLPLKIGMVGRMVPIKNHQMLFDAIQILKKEQELAHTQYQLVGDGHLRADLEAMAQQMGIGPQVHFAGWQLNIPTIYPPLHIVCLTSLNEGTPVSLIEAMAAGRPVIATDVGGVVDLIGKPPLSSGNGNIAPGSFRLCERGILVPSGDAPALAAALKHLVHRPETCRQLANAGRAFIAEHYTLGRLVRDIDHLYRELVSA